MEGTAEPGAAANLRNDARLLKTLLLAALVPEVPALRSLNAARLAALKHGSVVSPIPGLEGPMLLQNLRTLAAEIGEIKLSDDANPVISLQITGVDVEPILANAAAEDNEANRRRKIREILFAARAISNDAGLLGAQGHVEYTFEFRRTRRLVDLWLESVAALSGRFKRIWEQNRPQILGVADAQSIDHRRQVLIADVMLTEVLGPGRQDCFVLLMVKRPYLDLAPAGGRQTLAGVVQP